MNPIKIHFLDHIKKFIVNCTCCTKSVVEECLELPPNESIHGRNLQAHAEAKRKHPSRDGRV